MLRPTRLHRLMLPGPPTASNSSKGKADECAGLVIAQPSV
jgi:hypothetical protein